MQKIKPFCCDGIKILRGDFLDKNSKFSPPLRFSSEFDYGIDGRAVYFCPSCGKKFIQNASVEPVALNPDFCCETMEDRVNVPDNHDWFEIFYQPWSRRYFFSNTEDERDGRNQGKVYPEWDFQYCLFCGKKLPESLLEKWLEIVKNEFGVEKQEPFQQMLPLVPDEFRTDIWWKNRGL